MANEKHVELLKKGLQVWNDWRRQNEAHALNLLKGWSNYEYGEVFNKVNSEEFQNLIDIDLSESSLESLNLKGAMLGMSPSLENELKQSGLNSGDILEMTDSISLRRTNLMNADLSKSNLHSARLYRANLQFTNLEKADLSDSFLKYAILTGANLYNANLKNADLTKADFSELVRTSLILYFLVRDEYKDAVGFLSGANLKHANLENADFTKANFTAIDVRGLDFSKVKTLRKATFYKANLGSAKFDGRELKGCDFEGADLSFASLVNTNLSKTKLVGTNFSGAKLTKAILKNADLRNANFTNANLTEVDLSKMNLDGVNFSEAKLSKSNFRSTNLTKQNFFNANLKGADLSYTTLVETDFRGAILSNSRIYGISAWNITLDNTEQKNLIITPENEPIITVDNLEVAQFIYLILKNAKIREAINTITSKVVLILGRFTITRKKVLETIKEELRKQKYVPVLFDFGKPVTRDLQETVITLASLARFIIADITSPKSIIQELTSIIPIFPSIPVQPLLKLGSKPWATFEHFTNYPSVLKIYRYKDIKNLHNRLRHKIILDAESKFSELQRKGANTLSNF